MYVAPWPVELPTVGIARRFEMDYRNRNSFNNKTQKQLENKKTQKQLENKKTQKIFLLF